MTLGLPTSVTAALLLGAFQHYGPQPGPQRYSEPYIIGLISGPIAEANMRRALSISQGDWSVFVTHPISLVLLILAAAMLFVPMILSMKSTAN